MSINNQNKQAITSTRPFQRPSAQGIRRISTLPRFRGVQPTYGRAGGRLTQFIVPLIIIGQTTLRVGRNEQISKRARFANHRNRAQYRLNVLNELNAKHRRRFTFILNRTKDRRIRLQNFTLTTEALERRLRRHRSQLLINRQVFNTKYNKVGQRKSTPTSANGRYLRVISQMNNALIFKPDQVNRTGRSDCFNLVKHRRRINILTNRRVSTITCIRRAFRNFIMSTIQTINRP